MLNDIKEIISFQLTGKFAHFRKFYTNTSSLTYDIPPSTTISGMLASILKIPRDNYYEIFSRKNINISVEIDSDTNVKKITQSINYLHDKYFNLLMGKKGKFQHSQCKFELLMSNKSQKIRYNIFLAILTEHDIFSKLKARLKSHQFGYGIYLGQRPFKADIHNVKIYKSNEFEYLPKSRYLDSLCSVENLIEFDITKNPSANILKERIPVNFKMSDEGREIENIKTVFYDKNGSRLVGSFKNVVKLNDKFISFY